MRFITKAGVSKHFPKRDKFDHVKAPAGQHFLPTSDHGRAFRSGFETETLLCNGCRALVHSTRIKQEAEAANTAVVLTQKRYPGFGGPHTTQSVNKAVGYVKCTWARMWAPLSWKFIFLFFYL